MDGPPLSWHEIRALADIEAQLRTDEDLDHRLTTMSAPRERWDPRLLMRRCPRPPAWVVAVLVLLAVGVTSVVVQLRTETGYLLLALAWSAALLAASVRLTVRRTARARTEGPHP